MYSFIPQIFTELYGVRSTSHLLALSDRGPRGLFLPLGAGDDAAAHNNNTDANSHQVLAGHQTQPAAFPGPAPLICKTSLDKMIIPLGPKRQLRHGAVRGFLGIM